MYDTHVFYACLEQFHDLADNFYVSFSQFMYKGVKKGRVVKIKTKI